MKHSPSVVRRHPVLSTIGGLLVAILLLTGGLYLHALSYFDAEIFSDVPENEGKLRAMARRALPPGPDGPGTPPTFLVLGSAHLAQDDMSVPAAQQQKVVDALSEFEPDMLVVEELPPDWPRGKGRDYRHDFPMEKHAEQWTLPIDHAPAVIDSLGNRDTLSVREQCRLGKAYFLTWALANAAYQWAATECPVTQKDNLLGRWFRNEEMQSEMGLIGFPVARANGVKRVVPFDYQGDDAKFFIDDQLRRLAREWAVLDLASFWPVVRARYTQLDYEAEHSASLTSLLRFANGPLNAAMQYWTYEEVLPRIDYKNAGARQTKNYWLRNRKMFANVEEAIDEYDPDRVMIVVGLGHTYFLDVLIDEAGYRWVDPRDYLPGS